MLPLSFVNLMICAGVAILQVEVSRDGGQLGALPVVGIGLVSLALVMGALSFFKEQESKPYRQLQERLPEKKEEATE